MDLRVENKQTKIKPNRKKSGATKNKEANNCQKI